MREDEGERRVWLTAQDWEAVAADKHDKRYEFVPKALWGQVPNSWILMLEKSTRIALETSQLILSFLILYATIVGPPHRSEWVYLLTAILGPAAFAVWYIVFPLNPYRTLSAIREGMKDKDETDPDAEEFVALLKSSEARHFLLNRAWKLSLLFFVPMAIISAFMHRTPIWRFGADCVVRIPSSFLSAYSFCFEWNCSLGLLGAGQAITGSIRRVGEPITWNPQPKP